MGIDGRQKARVFLAQYICMLEIIFFQITTFIKVRVAFVLGLWIL